MSEEERREAVKVRRTFNKSRASNNRGRGGRGRGGQAAQSQRRPHPNSEPEPDIAEITSRSISCFNTEIAREIHDMPAIEDDDAESQEQFNQTNSPLYCGGRFAAAGRRPDKSESRTLPNRLGNAA